MTTSINNNYPKNTYALDYASNLTTVQQNNTKSERISTPRIEQPQNKLPLELLRIQEQQILQNLQIRDIQKLTPTYNGELFPNITASNLNCNTISERNTPINPFIVSSNSTYSFPYYNETCTIYYDAAGEILLTELKNNNGDITAQYDPNGKCIYAHGPSASNPTTNILYMRIGDRAITQNISQNGEIHIFTNFFDAGGNIIKYVQENCSTGSISTTYYNTTGEIIRWDTYEPGKTKTTTLKINNNLELLFDLLTSAVYIIKKESNGAGTFFSFSQMFSSEFTDNDLTNVLDTILGFKESLTTNITQLIIAALSYNEKTPLDSPIAKKRIAILDSYINNNLFTIDQQSYQVLRSIINEFISPTPSYSHLTQNLRTLFTNQNTTTTEQVIYLTTVIATIMVSYYDENSQTRGQFDSAAGYFENMFKGSFSGQCNDINPAIGRFIADVFDGVNGMHVQTGSFQYMANHVEAMIVIDNTQNNSNTLLIQNYGNIINTGINLKETGYFGLQTGLSIMEEADKNPGSDEKTRQSYGGSTQIRHALYDRDGKMVGYISSIDSILEHAGLVYDLENRLRPDQENTTQYNEKDNMITRNAQSQETISGNIRTTGMSTQTSTNIYARNDFIFDKLTANLDFDSAFAAISEEGNSFNSMAIIAQGALQLGVAQKNAFSLSAGIMLGTKFGIGNDNTYPYYIADALADTQFSGELYIQNNLSLYAGLSCTIWTPNVYNGIGPSPTNVNVSDASALTNLWTLIISPKKTELIPTKFTFGTHWAIDDKNIFTVGFSLEKLRYSASLGLTTQIGAVELNTSLFGSYDDLQPLFGVTTYNGLHTLGLTIDMKF